MKKSFRQICREMKEGNILELMNKKSDVQKEKRRKEYRRNNERSLIVDWSKGCLFIGWDMSEKEAEKIMESLKDG